MEHKKTAIKSRDGTAQCHRLCIITHDSEHRQKLKITN